MILPVPFTALVGPRGLGSFASSGILGVASPQSVTYAIIQSPGPLRLLSYLSVCLPVCFLYAFSLCFRWAIVSIMMPVGFFNAILFIVVHAQGGLFYCYACQWVSSALFMGFFLIIMLACGILLLFFIMLAGGFFLRSFFYHCVCQRGVVIIMLTGGLPLLFIMLASARGLTKCIKLAIYRFGGYGCCLYEHASITYVHKPCRHRRHPAQKTQSINRL